MSYDLRVYISRSGFPDPAEVYEMDREEEELLLGNPSSQVIFDRNKLPCASVLNEMEEELPVEINIIDEHSIGLSFPYWFDKEEATSLFDKINSYLKRLAMCGGYFVFDPQEERAFDPRDTDLEMTNSYEKGREVIRNLELGKTEVLTNDQIDKSISTNFLNQFWQKYCRVKTRGQKITIIIIFVVLLIDFIVGLK